MTPLLRRGLLDRRRALIVWALSVGLTGAFFMLVWPSIDDAISTALDSYPDSIKEAFGITSLSNAEQYLNAELFSFILPFALAIFALRTVASAIDGAQERGHLDVLLSAPISRRRRDDRRRRGQRRGVRHGGQLRPADRLPLLPQVRARDHRGLVDPGNRLRDGEVRMTPRTIGDRILRDAPLLHADDTIEDATRKLLDSDLPALPVVDSDERFAGIYGEREFMTAAFPGYLKQLKHAGFVSHSLDDALELNETCRRQPVSEHMNTEHVDVGPDFSDLEAAEIFLHHRVLVIPVVDDGEVQGVLTRADFFEVVARRLLGQL